MSEIKTCKYKYSDECAGKDASLLLFKIGRNICKKCDIIKNRERYEKNKESQREKNKIAARKYYLEHKDKVQEYNKKRIEKEKALRLQLETKQNMNPTIVKIVNELGL